MSDRSVETLGSKIWFSASWKQLTIPPKNVDFLFLRLHSPQHLHNIELGEVSRLLFMELGPFLFWICWLLKRKKYTADDCSHGNSPYREILTKKEEPIRTCRFTFAYNKRCYFRGCNMQCNPIISCSVLRLVLSNPGTSNDLYYSSRKSATYM